MPPHTLPLLRQNPVLPLLFLALAVATMGIGVIQDFSGPLLDGGDADQYAYK